MRIGLTGSSGLVGQALIPQLEQSGHQVVRIVRSRSERPAIFWDPDRGEIDSEGLARCDAVVHLAGENIAGRRWNAEQKARIRDSRVRGTRLLCDRLAQLERCPSVLIAASATGFYGDRGDYECDEAASSGQGFLAEVCVAWEAATEPALRAGIRVVNLRIGIVLSPRGGALQKMLLPFRLGGGGVVGSGRQYWSWISLVDLVRVVQHCLEDESLRGPVNAVAPRAVTNHEFTRALGHVLHRPTFVPLPAFMARLGLGEMADALLLASTRVVPQKLNVAGFPFSHPELESALQQLLAGA